MGLKQLIIKINYQVDLLIKLIPIFITIIILPMQFLVFNVIYKGKKVICVRRLKHNIFFIYSITFLIILLIGLLPIEIKIEHFI